MLWIPVTKSGNKFPNNYTGPYYKGGRGSSNQLFTPTDIAITDNYCTSMSAQLKALDGVSGEVVALGAGNRT